MRKLFSLSIIFVLCASLFSAHSAAQSSPLRFRITLSKELAPAGASGRLLVFMTDSPEPKKMLGIDFLPGGMWIAAMEVEHIAPGGAIDLDADTLAFPRPFSQARPGAYQVMALLDPNHSYAYHGGDEGDLSSEVIKVENLNPASSAPIELTLTRRAPEGMKVADTDSVKLVEFQSPLLTAFWGRPIRFRAGVVLPPSYGRDAKRNYAAVYHVHGFGGDHRTGWRQSAQLTKSMSEGKFAEMIHIFLDGSFTTGHHEFADSVNNGPWGKALTEEFIPHLEKSFRLAARSGARFLTGHSSGGWSTLWLQITYPDYFGGAWSTAPDPVDLRRFTGVDAAPGSTDNAYRTREGKAKNLVRMGGRDVVTIEEYARMEEVTGEYGGQLA